MVTTKTRKRTRPASAGSTAPRPTPGGFKSLDYASTIGLGSLVQAAHAAGVSYERIATLLGMTVRTLRRFRDAA